MTCGPYRPIKLISYNVRIDSVHARARVSPAPELAPSLVVDATLSGDLSLFHTVAIMLRDRTGGLLRMEQVALAGDVNRTSAQDFQGIVNWSLGDIVKLWWPVGYGAQELYDVEVSILDKVGRFPFDLLTRLTFVTERCGLGCVYSAHWILSCGTHTRASV